MSKNKHPKHNTTHQNNHENHNHNEENYHENYNHNEENYQDNNIEVINDDLQKLKDENENLHKIILSLKEKTLSLSADIANITRRQEIALQNMSDYAITNFASDLLNVLDPFEQVLQLESNFMTEDSNKVNSIFQGIKMSYKIFEDILNKYGIRKILPQNEMFDHNYHHAISQTTSPDYKNDEIVQVVRVGYLIKDRVLRPAMVVVNKI
jgi:molecular chaperone GrpE